MGKMQRSKGKRGEREAVALLKRIYPDAKRGWWQSRGGSEVPDVEGTPWWVEVKLGKHPNAMKALQQAEDNTFDKDVRPPLALCRQDKKEWTVTMLAEDFIKLMQKLQKSAVADQDWPTRAAKEIAKIDNSELDEL